MIVSLVGLLLSILALRIFWNALNRPLTHNFHLAVILSLLLLSGFGVLVFLALLLNSLWRNQDRLHRYGGDFFRRLRGKQPSEFVHDWSNRATTSYEYSRRYSREHGHQAAFRLKWDRDEPPKFTSGPPPTGRGDRPRNVPASAQPEADPGPGNTDRNEPDNVY